jgi:hypothetical protein
MGHYNELISHPFPFDGYDHIILAYHSIHTDKPHVITNTMLPNVSKSLSNDMVVITV